jgi:hypothetical protein
LCPIFLGWDSASEHIPGPDHGCESAEQLFSNIDRSDSCDNYTKEDRAYNDSHWDNSAQDNCPQSTVVDIPSGQANPGFFLSRHI